jgi:hypothetical protein
MKYFSLLMALAVVALASCTKSENSKQPADTLRASKWMMNTFTMKYDYMGTETVLDLYNAMDTCYFDDYYEFGENFEGFISTGTKKCGSESNKMSFDWELRNNNKTLMINNAQYMIGNANSSTLSIPGGNPLPAGMEYVEATVKKLSASTLTITYSYVRQYAPSVPSTTYFFTQTFNRVL